MRDHYRALYESFRWNVPDEFNIAEVCCRRWANESSRIALHCEDDQGRSSSYTYAALQAANAPRWQIMPAGTAAEGFVNDEMADTNDQHDYGTDWMAATIRAAAADYRDTYLRTNPTAAMLTVRSLPMTRKQT